MLPVTTISIIIGNQLKFTIHCYLGLITHYYGYWKHRVGSPGITSTTTASRGWVGSGNFSEKRCLPTPAPRNSQRKSAKYSWTSSNIHPWDGSSGNQDLVPYFCDCALLPGPSATPAKPRKTYCYIRNWIFVNPCNHAMNNCNPNRGCTSSIRSE